MENFYTRVMGWSTARNILKGSTWQKQRTKTWEELTELAEGISKSKLDLAKDAIGDCAVTTANMAGCMGLDPVQIGVMAEESAEAEREEFECYDVDGLVNLFVQHTSVVRTASVAAGPLDVVTGFGAQHHIVIALAALEHCARRLGLTFEECQEHAWNEIKDRKGMMISGVFVKEKDLSSSLSYALRHALMRTVCATTFWRDLNDKGQLLTEEGFLKLFANNVRNELSNVIDVAMLGLHVDTEVTITAGDIQHQGFYDCIESMVITAHAILEMGGDRPVQFSAVERMVGNAYKPENAQWPLDTLQLVQVYPLSADAQKLIRRNGLSDCSPKELGQQLIDQNLLPENVNAAVVKVRTFDNGIPFFDVHFSGNRTDAGKTVPEWYVASVLVV